MGYIGERRSRPATISNDDVNPYGNGFWRIEFTPADFALGTNTFEVYHIYLEGPQGSTFRVVVNTRPYSTSQRGDLNEWDPNNPLTMYGGQSLNFYWNSSATPAPLVVLSLQTPRT